MTNVELHLVGVLDGGHIAQPLREPTWDAAVGAWSRLTLVGAIMATAVWHVERPEPLRPPAKVPAPPPVVESGPEPQVDALSLFADAFPD